MMTVEETPRIWVGCLGCYNAGNLFGYWVDAVDAPETTEEWLTECRRQGQNVARPGIYDQHEELWCFDHEYLPISGECSPMEAQRIARALADVPDHIPAAAVRAYAENIGSGLDWDTFASEVEDHYMGTYDSFRDYADELAADDLRAHDIADDHPLARYFDYEQHARELEMEMTVLRDDGNVHVFSD